TTDQLAPNTDQVAPTATSYQTNKQVAMKSMAVIPKINFEPTDTETVTIGMPVEYFEYDPDYLSIQNTDLDSELQLKSNLVLKSVRFPNHRMAFGCSASLKQFNSDSVPLYPVFFVRDDVASITLGQSNRLGSEADFQWIETSIFFEDNYQLTKKLTLLAGVRYDAIPSSSLEFTNIEDFNYINKDGKTMNVSSGESMSLDFGTLDLLIPRIGITYDIDDDKTVKLIYQEGYHIPDYINTMKELNFNKRLIEEEIKSCELGYYQEFMEKKCQFNFNIYGNIFQNTVFNLIDSNSDGENDIIITDDFLSTGFETSLVFLPDNKTRMEFSYAFSQPHNLEDDPEINPHLVDSSGERWKAFPEHTIKINMNRSFMNEKLDISLGSLFNKGIETVGMNELNNSRISTIQKSTTDLFNHDRFVVNAAARYHITGNCSLTIKGENIFDNDVPAAGYYYDLQNLEEISLEHPTYTIGLRWTF
ncbi:MAG: TonB-dependent receptor, partial [Desulfamplus sp.]|nr:TonB-dependent receptor [Desulfamplus sp.]